MTLPRRTATRRSELLRRCQPGWKQHDPIVGNAETGNVVAGSREARSAQSWTLVDNGDVRRPDRCQRLRKLAHGHYPSIERVAAWSDRPRVRRHAAAPGCGGDDMTQNGADAPKPDAKQRLRSVVVKEAVGCCDVLFRMHAIKGKSFGGTRRHLFRPARVKQHVEKNEAAGERG